MGIPMHSIIAIIRGRIHHSSRKEMIDNKIKMKEHQWISANKKKLVQTKTPKRINKVSKAVKTTSLRHRSLGLILIRDRMARRLIAIWILLTSAIIRRPGTIIIRNSEEIRQNTIWKRLRIRGAALSDRVRPLSSVKLRLAVATPTLQIISTSRTTSVVAQISKKWRSH